MIDERVSCITDKYGVEVVNCNFEIETVRANGITTPVGGLTTVVMRLNQSQLNSLHNYLAVYDFDSLMISAAMMAKSAREVPPYVKNGQGYLRGDILTICVSALPVLEYVLIKLFTNME